MHFALHAFYYGLHCSTNYFLLQDDGNLWKNDNRHYLSKSNTPICYNREVRIKQTRRGSIKMEENDQLVALQKRIDELEASIKESRQSSQTPYVKPKPAFPKELKEKYSKLLFSAKE